MGKNSIYVIATLYIGHSYKPIIINNNNNKPVYYAKNYDAYVSLNWLTPRLLTVE